MPDDTDRLTCFFYLLARDHLPFGVVAQIVAECEAISGDVRFSDPDVKAWAERCIRWLGQTNPRRRDPMTHQWHATPVWDDGVDDYHATQIEEHRPDMTVIVGRTTGYAEGLISDEEDQRNGRLMAAAKELADALAGMVDMFERHVDGRPGPDDAAQRWDAAPDALAKVR